MSLWSVPDGATKELMTRFYKNIVLEQDVETAFSHAQKTMDKDGYGILGWGGFVLLH
jgi:CHAT domain-containing protein